MKALSTSFSDLILRFFLFLGCGLLLCWITSHSPPPEASDHLWFALPGFMILLMGIVSYFSWGAFLRVRTGIELTGAAAGMFDLAFGTLSIFFFSYALTLVGLFQSSKPVFAWIVLSAGFSIGFPHIRARAWLMPPKDLIGRIFFCLPLLVIILRLIEGLQFPSHGDSYYVYLPAPRSWAMNGNFSAYPNFSDFFFTTTWESLYAMGTVLMGLTGGHGLDLTQWYCQWITAGVALPGIVLSMIATSQNLSKFFAVDRRWWVIPVVYSLQIPCLRWTANLAKNDMGIIFWGVASWFLVIFSKNGTAAYSFLTGSLTGAMAIGKLNTALFAIILGVSFLFFNPKKTLFFILGGLTSVAPVILRNLIMTGNPVFPWLSSLFGTLDQLGLASAAGSEALTKVNMSPAALWAYAKGLFLETPLFPFLIVGLLSRLTREPRGLVTIPLFALVLYTSTLGISTEMRLQGPPLIILSFLSAYFALHFFSKLSRNHRFEWAPILFILATSNISLFTLAQLGGPKFGTWKNRIPAMGEVGGEAKIWIRENIPQNATILLIGDGYSYYLTDLSIIPLSKFRNIEVPLLQRNMDEVIHQLLKTRLNYLYITDNTDFPANRAIDAEVIAALTLLESKCHVFQSLHAHVWDLDCLRKLKTAQI